VRRASRLFVALTLAALPTATASPAGAKTPGPNGQIAFSRYDQATGEPRMFIANSDGTHEHQLLLPLPRMVPSGHPTRISCSSPSSDRRRQSGRPRSTRMGPALRSWTSPNSRRTWTWAAGPGRRLRCQAIRFEGDPSLNGHLHHPRRQRQRPPAAHRQPIPATRRFRRG
jgi:hypothetical protein